MKVAPVRTRISFPGKEKDSGWSTTDALIALAIIAIAASSVLGGTLTLGKRSRDIAGRAVELIAGRNAWSDAIVSSFIE